MAFRVVAAFVLSFSIPAAPALSKEVRLTLREGTNFAAARAGGDGSYVLDLHGTLWRLPEGGGKAAAMTDGLGDDRLPDVSRDGSRIVFQSYRSGTWDIWSMSADGSSAAAMTSGPADDREPVLSPDSSRVAFSSDRSGNYDIWVLELASSELKQLTTDAAQDYMPAWTPAGDEIVFVSDRAANRTPGLVRVKASGEGEAVPVAEIEGAVSSPSVSADGKLVAFRVLTLGNTGADAMGRAAEASRLAVVSLAGGEPRLLDTPDDVFPFRPQWSGTNEIVYTAAGSLWRQGLEPRSEARKVPFEAEVVLDRPTYRRRPVDFPKSRERRPVRGIVRPVVSPDHSLIVYAALGDLFVVSTEGGSPIPLTRDEYLDTDPHWAPDSRSIVFASDRAGTMDLWIKDVEAPPTEGERRLTTSLGAEVSPAWSPDGKTIAYVDHDSRLHVVGIQGEEDRALTEPRHGVGIPTWSTDSRHVAMSVQVPLSSRFREGYNRVLVVDTTTGDSRLLEEPDRSIGVRDGDGPVWRPDGGALAFAMDGGLWTLPMTPDARAGGRPRQIAGEVADFLSWSGDGKKIVFLGAGGLAEVEVETGDVRRIDVEHEFEVTSAEGRLLIRNVRLVDGTGAAPRDGMDVVIEGDRIARVEPTGGEVAEEVRVVSGEGKTLIPGLIEMHTHLGLPAWEAARARCGWPTGSRRSGLPRMLCTGSSKSGSRSGRVVGSAHGSSIPEPPSTAIASTTPAPWP